jgi:cytochrome c6
MGALLRRLRLLLVMPMALLLLAGAWGFGPRPALAAADGAALFDNHCAGCHVRGGNIIRRGKTLKLAVLERQGLASTEAIARVAAEGLGQMSGYATALGEGGPDAVAAYVWQRALEGWS